MAPEHEAVTPQVTDDNLFRLQLFDEKNHVNQDASNYIFSTEGHIFKLDTRFRKRPWDLESKRYVQKGTKTASYIGSVGRHNDSIGVGRPVQIYIQKAIVYLMFSDLLLADSCLFVCLFFWNEDATWPWVQILLRVTGWICVRWSQTQLFYSRKQPTGQLQACQDS